MGELLSHKAMNHYDFSSLKKDANRKSHLLYERGHKCEVCGLTEWMGKPAPIELDHIDGNCENNVKDNLRLICCNCHAQTDSYRGKNVGKSGNTKRAQTLKKYGSYRS